MVSGVNTVDGLDWQEWERLFRDRGVEIDRPKGSEHPRWAGWIYPLDYGFIPGTRGRDGAEVDVFTGSAATGLKAALVVRHDDVDELKLMWNTTPEEVHLASRFLEADMLVTILWRSAGSSS